MKFAGKWMELERNHPEWGNPDSERQKWNDLTHKCILDVKQKITKLQSSAIEKLGNKEAPKWDAWITLGKVNR